MKWVCVCVCVCVLFGPVKPESGVIPSGQKKHLTINTRTLSQSRINEDGLQSSYDDVIFAVVDFLTNEILALQHRCKKCVDRKENYIEK